MKKLSIYTITLAMLILGSCTKDYLDTEPMTELTSDSFYQNPGDAYDALVGCYDGMQIAVGASGLSFPIASEVLSDDCFGGTGNSDGFGYQMLDEFDVSRSPSDVDLYNDTWIKYYQAIFRCNTLLQKMDQIDWSGNEELQLTYESEARFIRAYLYFDLVRLFGQVPLLTEPSDENIPQSAPEEIYAVIAQDLLFASENMSSEPYTSVQAGRVTKWAAKSMLARVYLYYTGYYGASDLVGLVNQSSALAQLEDVIAQSGHGLVDDFSTLWPAASVENFEGENNKEIVFSIKFTYTSDYDGNTDGNHWMVMFGMREFDYYPFGRGWGVTVNPELYNLYEEGDARRAATIIAIDEDEIPFENQDKQREYTGYYNKKYSPMTDYDEDGNLGSVAEQLGALNFQIGQFQDYYVMRYADVLLMAAELGSSNAQQYFDEVRQRALGDNFVSLTANKSNIMKERHKEFAMEGIRYWDLLRQGVSTAASTLATSTTVLNGGVTTEKTISAGNIQTTEGLQQIPNTQITLSNNVLKENTGW
ncbi:RagB/SusD family nutrient uptake outer membrane protein [Galbibacter pacificus]|uniref:RagB/SusD family nutrient uptake outer membrane protein n=1 Tax=Galbibacter pacificus TaxID=2996052 RepID=A0ABT6FRQ6_9FLAO|nr:RagB/SusD family nutrient uptake outer membrane protein [Galbibacter pacificus]MDG3581724.1 RagB/SusD family nutrient uptake outer membrane protein [Galbibacter pacificus]MDG3585802.1 RagB/SusD family nutrient uptake outer membrane protein [Galbibacter pacificus]